MTRNNSPEEYGTKGKEDPSRVGSLRMTRRQHNEYGSGVPSTSGYDISTEDVPILDTMSDQEVQDYFRETEQNLRVLEYLAEKERGEGRNPNPRALQAHETVLATIRRQFEDNIKYAKNKNRLPEEFKELAEKIVLREDTKSKD